MKKLIKPIVRIFLISFFFSAFFSACSENGAEGDDKIEPEATLTIPKLNTLPVTSVSNNSAETGGEIIENGGSEITERGVCWSKLTNPNINNSIVKSGKGDGNFTTSITGLEKSTKYYIRAYAINSTGVGYGNELEFETSNLESIEVNGYTLYIHPNNSANVSWGPDQETTGANDLNDGKANTEKLSKRSGVYASNVCNDLVSQGYDDWYLPAKSEMEAIKLNADKLPSINSGSYWTSTENNERTAYTVYFTSGPPPYNIKTAKEDCRCVRRD